jgi:hypothetical protein
MVILLVSDEGCKAHYAYVLYVSWHGWPHGDEDTNYLNTFPLCLYYCCWVPKKDCNEMAYLGILIE